MRQIHEHSETDIIKFLVANKCDLSDRKVQYERGKMMASKFQMDFLEVSAKDGTNINELFAKLGERVYDYIKKTQNIPLKDNGSQKRISLHKK